MRSSATFTAVAAPIGAGDVMGGAQEFSNFGPQIGGPMLIMSATLLVAHTALIASEDDYVLHLYNVTPPSALADNAAWDLPAGDRAAYLGNIAFEVPVDLGSTLWIETNNINKMIEVPSGGRLFGYLVTVAGFTPTAAERIVTLIGK